jgi:O-acetyl-ADP-ribose deacetylase (regulator of RNase III)
MEQAAQVELALLFFDYSNKIDDYREIIGEQFTGRAGDGVSIHTYFVKTDVRELVKEYNINCIVPPANSLGFMDGGIDMFYMQMFPGIQNIVQDRIKTFDITTALGRYVLPIGSAMLVKTGNEKCPLLVCVPTMFLPEDIAMTRNVYWAFTGLLNLAKQSFFPKDESVGCRGPGYVQLGTQCFMPPSFFQPLC